MNESDCRNTEDLFSYLAERAAWMARDATRLYQYQRNINLTKECFAAFLEDLTQRIGEIWNTLECLGVDFNQINETRQDKRRIQVESLQTPEDAGFREKATITAPAFSGITLETTERTKKQTSHESGGDRVFCPYRTCAYGDSDKWMMDDSLQLPTRNLHVTSADFAELPFPDGRFDRVVLEPQKDSHTSRNTIPAGKDRMDQDMDTKLKNAFRECMRVIRPNGNLFFVWEAARIPVSEILQLCYPEKPVSGEEEPVHGKTYEIHFCKWTPFPGVGGKL